MSRPKSRMTLQERLISYVIPEPYSGCWLWTGAVYHPGTQFEYGALRANGKTIGAHRLSYQLFRGEIPEHLHCCHKCDTPLCCNPDHLFLGTNKENHMDASRKGRTPRGERSGSAVLKNNDVLEIRRLHKTGRWNYPKLGELFGVDFSAIYKIVKRKRWSHI